MGATQNLRGRKKFSESVKEIFPIPEFNTYQSQATKKKSRRKLSKAQTAMQNFRSQMSGQLKSTMNEGAGESFPVPINLPLPQENKGANYNSMSSFGSKPKTRAQTHYGHRQSLYSKELEEERREIEEIQESMKQMDEFDKKYGSVKSKVGYPRVALKADLKIT